MRSLIEWDENTQSIPLRAPTNCGPVKIENVRIVDWMAQLQRDTG